jgi:hypothetical protein
MSEYLEGYSIIHLPTKYNKTPIPKKSFKNMKAKDRIIFAASIVCSQKEIANTLGISQQAVSKVIGKIRRG